MEALPKKALHVNILQCDYVDNIRDVDSIRDKISQYVT